MPPPTADNFAAGVLAEAARRGHSELLLERPLVVGVSGGADSLALLHMLVRLRGAATGRTLHVAHLDHRVRGHEARADAEFVLRTAEEWGMPVTIAEFDVPDYAHRKGLSTEDAARRGRYAFLASVAQRAGAAIAVAHNADDQVETVLMAILRGTGPTGLSGMQPLGIVAVPDDPELEAAFQYDTSRTVELYRPLLGVWRHEIEDYCGRHALQPRVDSTNLDHAYRRNRVRHDLIPYLQRHYSLAIKEHLFRLSLIARSEDELVAAWTDDLWGQLTQIESSGRSVVFDIAEFASQPEALRRRLARRALQAVAGTLAGFSFAHIEAAVAIMSGEAWAPPALDLPHGVRVERTAGKSSVRGRDDARGEYQAAACGRPLAADAPIDVVPGSTVALEPGWTLETAVASAPAESAQAGDWCALFDYDALVQVGPLVLRRRAPGDYIRPLGMSGRRSLQDLIVDAKIPRWCRPYLAVLAPEGSHEVLWVPGPGGRRTGYAPLTRDTRRVLEMRFAKQD